MVYLLNSRYSENQPDAWLCGGVLVSTIHVLTAAACLTEVTHIYVIAGYKKYVSGENIQNDECTRTRKQRIVKVIIPKAFNPSTWMKFDVGLGVVEKPYIFYDVSYRTVCSYEPEGIAINYDPEMEAPNSKVVALGWGAAKPGMGADINSEYLMEAHTIITNTSYCRKQFPKNAEFLFLCTHSLVEAVKIKAHLTNTEKKKVKMISSTTGSTGTKRCFREMWRRNCKNNSLNVTPVESLDMLSSEVMFSRRTLTSNGSGTFLDEINDGNKTLNVNKLNMNNTRSRKQREEYKPFGGICENDHGGPLIATEGKLEMVIGIALNSVYSKKYQCEGPFLYLSTARSKPLIKCLLSSDENKREQCKSMNYEIREYHVKWPAVQKRHGNCENGVSSKQGTAGAVQATTYPRTSVTADTRTASTKF